MNIIEPLPDYIELEYHDKIWQQPLDTNISHSNVGGVMNMTTGIELAH